MGQEDLIKQTAEAVFKLDRDKSDELIEEALKLGINLTTLINEGLTSGLRILGERFEAGEVFLPELMLGAEIVQRNVKKVEPFIKDAQVERKAKMVIGTVQGDLHDVGKNIVAAVFSASGFAIVDLGIDVATNTFVEAVKRERPELLGLSALLTTTMHIQREIIEALENADLRKNVKVIVGGAPTSGSWAQKIRADAYAEDAFQGLLKAEQLLELAFTKKN
jgi:corrinoid protein of di/trimethylamine methyltransferase